jgi:serine/threonine protein kinase
MKSQSLISELCPEAGLVGSLNKGCLSIVFSMPQVCDFGLSKIVHLNVEPEQKPFGTLIYMAPEVS